MFTGTITIESGSNKAVISITDDKVNINFEPQINKIPKNENEAFIHNITASLIEAIGG